jgi:hypothetical protein
MCGSIFEEQSKGQTAATGLLMMVEVRTRMKAPFVPENFNP